MSQGEGEGEGGGEEVLHTASQPKLTEREVVLIDDTTPYEILLEGARKNLQRKGYRI